MTHCWHDIPTTNETIKDYVHAIIEIPDGCQTKYEYDKEYGILRLDRVLYTSTHYPADYGFVPQTLADDNDPLDILVLCREHIVPGVLVRARIIGAFILKDGEEMDEKLIAVCADDPAYNGFHEITDMPEHTLEEMRHFFDVYKDLEGKKTHFIRRVSAADALQIVTECQERYKQKFPKN